jgi:WD40 repeat protein
VVSAIPHLLVCIILSTNKTTTGTMSNKHTAGAAVLNDDAPRECDVTPVIPINLISHLILPFLPDRTTWNAVCSTNKELHQAGLKFTPPWPATKLRLGRFVEALKFSPCGSFLALGANVSPFLVHICDRRGRQTCLSGHTSGISILSFSNDGNYLASAGSRRGHRSIRIWPTNSTTRLPQQSDKMLRGHQRRIDCFDFSPGDSNLLASGDARAIKLWDIEQEVCIYSFDHSRGYVRSMYLSAGDEAQKCIFVTTLGSLIRTSLDDLSYIESDIVDMPILLGRVLTSAFSHCGSLLATVSPDGHLSTLYDMRTMTVVRSLSRLSSPQRMSLGPYTCLAFSPDGKTLVLRCPNDEIQIRDVPDLNLLRSLIQPHASATMVLGAIAFDPSGQFLASARGDENVRLWTL